MKFSQSKAFSIAVIAVILVSAFPVDQAQEQTRNYTVSFLLQNQPDGDKTYELNVTIPQTLYAYYFLQNHALYTQTDIEKFVTPDALKPVADKLWQIYNNTEDFTNGVLMLVHQLEYRETLPCKYPVETLVNGYGDCDLFALMAVSILEAGGINSVLLYYKEKLHMEIGVDLGVVPAKARVQTYSVPYENVSYYIGECTGGNWRTGWRIGETPSAYQNITSQVLTFEGMEQTSSAQVTATLRELDHSAVALQVTPSLMLEGNNTVALNGQIEPQVANENVTLQAKINGGGWSTIGTVETQPDGTFNYSWAPSAGGTIEFQASWVGNSQYNGATSAQTGLTILPLFIVVLVAALVFAVVVLAIVIVKTMRRKPEPPQPAQPAQPPLETPLNPNPAT